MIRKLCHNHYKRATRTKKKTTCLAWKSRYPVRRQHYRKVFKCLQWNQKSGRDFNVNRGYSIKKHGSIFFFRIFIIISEPELKLVSVPQLFRFRYLHKKGVSKKKKEYPAFEFYHHTCVKSIYTVPPDFLFIAYIPRLLSVFRLPPNWTTFSIFPGRD